MWLERPWAEGASCDGGLPVRPGVLAFLKMVAAEGRAGEVRAEWYRLTPALRWEETSRLWQIYIELGGSRDPEPDTPSSFFDATAPGSLPAHGRPSLRIVRRSGDCRDTELAILASEANLARLRKVLEELREVGSFETRTASPHWRKLMTRFLKFLLPDHVQSKNEPNVIVPGKSTSSVTVVTRLGTFTAPPLIGLLPMPTMDKLMSVF